MPITVLKNNVPWGPFTREQIDAGLARGDFTLASLAHGPGLKEWLPLGDVIEAFDRDMSLPPVPGARFITAMPGGRLPSVGAAAVNVPVAAAADPIAMPPPLSGPAFEPALPLSPEPVLAARKVGPSNTPITASSPAAQAKPGVPARFFPRFLAFVIDCAVLFLPIVFIFALAALAIRVQGWIEHSDDETMRQVWILWDQNFRGVLGLVAIGGAWLYAAALECSRWQATVGKQWVGLKVTDVNGERLSFLHATGRHAAKFLSGLPLFLGFTMALFSSEGMSLHDRLARTRVVRKDVR